MPYSKTALSGGIHHNASTLDNRKIYTFDLYRIIILKFSISAFFLNVHSIGLF